jgi:hypothetical protein
VPAADADVVVVAEGETVSIRFDGREHRFEGRVGDAQEGADRIDIDAVPERSGGEREDRTDATTPGAANSRGVAPEMSGGSGGGRPRGSERGGIE